MKAAPPRTRCPGGHTLRCPQGETERSSSRAEVGRFGSALRRSNHCVEASPIVGAVYVVVVSVVFWCCIRSAALALPPLRYVSSVCDSDTRTCFGVAHPSRTLNA